MLRSLQIAAVVLVAVAMALSLAHALELPGKMRLDKNAYVAVQKIYYPGFTFGGIAEPTGIAVLLVLVALTPYGTAMFGWTLAALTSLVATHAIYWLVTHPVNGFWTKDIELSGLGAAFFSAFTGDISGDWARMRDVWEYSHLARSVLAMLSLVFLLMAVTG